MRISRAGLVLIASVVIVSITIASFLNSISVDSFLEDEEMLKSYKLPADKLRKTEIGDKAEHLVWFAQVSDLHLSIFQDNDRATELLELCDYTFKVIKPFVILATGDLTDAKQKDLIGSRQFEDEWKKYRGVLDRCRTVKKTPWLDIRGNHDNFDVPDISSKRNFFRNYSMQGGKYSRSYAYTGNVGSEKYAFVGIDACPVIGLRRPFNFIGALPDTEISELKKLVESVKDVDYIIWFGHYPTSCILSRYPGVKSVIASHHQSMAYLCGHFHALLGFVPQMYTLQKSGFFELELADWKDNRVFRIAAIDHGLFSFVDVKHREWPVILVTNPKHALFQSSIREPLAAMSSSTHVRILVFSPSQIITVRVKIENEPWDHALPVSEQLFVFPWKPSKYSKGVRYIRVSVLDKDGRERTIVHPFSLDQTRLQFGFLPRVLLMLNFSVVMQVLYGLAVLSCVLPYCFLRYMNRKSLESKKHLPSLKDTFAHRWLRRIWILSNTNVFFYPIVLYPLYISFGPWAIAELMEGQYGVIFIWGIFVNGTFLPGAFTYGYAFLQLFLFHGPLVSFTAYSIDKRLSDHTNSSTNNTFVWVIQKATSHIPYIVLLMSQILMAYAFYLAYGAFAILAGPVRLWPIALVLWVWYQSENIPVSKMKKASRVWDRDSSTATR